MKIKSNYCFQNMVAHLGHKYIQFTLKKKTHNCLKSVKITLYIQSRIDSSLDVLCQCNQQACN